MNMLPRPALSPLLILLAVSALRAQTSDSLADQINRRTGNWLCAPVEYTDGSAYYINLKTQKLSPSPTIFDGMVFVATDSGHVIGANGIDITEGYVATGQVYGSPVVTATRLYAVVTEGNVQAFDRKTGETLWTFKGEEPTLTSPCLADGRLYFSTMGSRLHALDAETGKLLWSYKAGRDVYSPAFAEGVVYVGTDKPEVHAVDAAKGSVIWKYEGGGGGVSIDDKRLYCRGSEGELVVLDRRTGKKLHAVPTGSVGLLTPVLTPGGTAVVLSVDGRLQASDPKGNVLWTQSLDGGPFHSPPSIAGDILYVSTFDSRLHAIGLADGEFRWTGDIGFGYGMAGSPVATDHTVYCTRDTKLYIISDSDGMAPVTQEDAEAEVDELSPSDDIFKAASDGDIDRLRSYLDGGGRIDTADEYGITLMMRAAWHDVPEAVTFLLERGVPVDEVDPKGLTALMHAAWEGAENAVRVLLDSGANVNAADSYGQTALMHAAIENAHDAVRVLLDRGASVAPVDSDGKSALHLAAAAGADEVVELLLDRGAEIDARTPEGRTALMAAADQGKESTVALLIRRKGALELRSIEGMTALGYAVNVSNIPVSSMLIDAGADINAVDEQGRTPLILACYYAYEEMADTLIARGADPNRPDPDGFTPLMFAAQKGSTSIIRALLAKRVDREAKTRFGDTALDLAVAGEYTEAAALLRGTNEKRKKK